MYVYVYWLGAVWNGSSKRRLVYPLKGSPPSLSVQARERLRLSLRVGSKEVYTNVSKRGTLARC